MIDSSSSRRSILAFLFFFTLSAILVTSNEAEESGEPLEIRALTEERDQFLLGKVDELAKKYAGGLEKYRLAWTEQNRLDDALKAMEMKEQLLDRKTFDELSAEDRASLRGELRRVLDAWDQAITQFNDEANSLLKQRLQDLREGAIKNGNLPLVKGVDQALNDLEKPIATLGADDAKDAEMEDDSLPKTWSWGSGGTLQLLRNGTAIHSRWGGNNGHWKWTRRGSRLDLFHPDGSVMKVELNRDGTGTVTSRIGATTTITPLNEDQDPPR
ncbi:MAG: hypothetical protein KDN19_21235 [Verrucomicrobiae bacterium]|nr:hypothetical protein [Verrucomicrobiae bacterium]